jgi:hypothetical protein
MPAFTPYPPPTIQEIDEDVVYLIRIMRDFLNVNEGNENRYFVDSDILREIIIRIDQRIYYHMVFHNGRHMSELRRTALLAYWILKYKPIHYIAQGVKGYEKNCAVAMHFLTAAASGYLFTLDGGQSGLRVSKGFIERMMYGFKHWDISKESMMCIIESIAGA